MPERVLRQFERVQSILRHPNESAPTQITLGVITLRFQRVVDYALTPEQLVQYAVHGVEAVEGYIQLFYHWSHPHMILPDMTVPVPRPPEREVMDEVAAQEDG